MANITNYLNKIKTAVYGKDVRGAIHDAIKQVYDDASVNHDNANMEVKMARGTHNTLNDRLDNVDEIQAQTNAQLSQKANSNDVRKNNVEIDLNDFSERTLKAIQGGGEVQFSLLSVPRNRSVDPEKTTFVSVGKNLFDKKNALLKKQLLIMDGTILPDTSDKKYYVSNFIYVEKGELYRIPYSCRNYCYYTDSYEFLKGVDNPTSSGVTITAEYTGFIRFTSKEEFIDFMQVEKGDTTTEYEEYRIFINELKINDSNIVENAIDNKHLKDGIITDSKIFDGSNIVVKKPGKNLLKTEKDSLTTGYYVNYQTGNLVSLSSTSVTDYIEIEANEQYVFSPMTEQYAFYDRECKYISGGSGSSSEKIIMTPENAKYIRVTIANKNLNSQLQLEKGAEPTEYEEWQCSIKLEDLPGSITKALESKIITVKKDGTGDFLNLRDAVESIGSGSKDDTIEIQMFEGIYNIYDDFTVEEIENESFVGIWLKDYVNLTGIGNVTLYGKLGDGYSNAAKKRVSTINIKKNTTIKNVTVICENIRYAIHDDCYNKNKDYTISCYDCTFINNGGNGGHGSAWGEGCGSGSFHYFENCEFITKKQYSSAAYSTHCWQDFNKKSNHEFVNCRFVNSFGGLAAQFRYMGSKKKNNVSMIGCSIIGKLSLEEVVDTGDGMFILNGYDNDTVVYNVVKLSNQQLYYNFKGETQEYINVHSDVIRKSTPVKFDGSGVSPLENDDISTFCGVMFKDSEDGVCLVKHKGYISLEDIGLETAQIGDKIGITSGKLSVTDKNVIGFVAIEGFMKFF